VRFFPSVIPVCATDRDWRGVSAISCSSLVFEALPKSIRGLAIDERMRCLDLRSLV
jgi:hypothetical protein